MRKRTYILYLHEKDYVLKWQIWVVDRFIQYNSYTFQLYLPQIKYICTRRNSIEKKKKKIMKINLSAVLSIIENLCAFCHC